MGYLGINKDSEDKGLYYFTSLRMRDEIGAKYSDAHYYLDSAKERAMKEFGVTEDEIKDGRDLINMYYKDVMILYYLGIPSGNYKGVYFFKTESVRDRVSHDFADSIVSNSKDEILEKMNVTVDDIKDGGILMSKEVREYIKTLNPKGSKKSKVVTSEKAIKGDSQKDDTASDKGVIKVENSTESAVDKNNNFLRVAINRLMGTPSNNNVAELRMVDGTIYVLTLRPVFYMLKDVSLENCAYIDDTGTPCVKPEAVEKLIAKGDIFVGTASKVTYGENNLVVVNDFDDEYSPNILTTKEGNFLIEHMYSKMVINAGQIVSVCMREGYRDLDFVHITADKYRLVYDYLKEKYKTKK